MHRTEPNRTNTPSAQWLLFSRYNEQPNGRINNIDIHSHTIYRIVFVALYANSGIRLLYFIQWLVPLHVLFELIELV